MLSLDVFFVSIVRAFKRLRNFTTMGITPSLVLSDVKRFLEDEALHLYVDIHGQGYESATNIPVKLNTTSTMTQN